uniref:Uncharacterized protein n=1 Tax=Plectus sambesii TaxID=2011161 RepID=A0A914WXQ2_9BILA
MAAQKRQIIVGNSDSYTRATRHPTPAVDQQESDSNWLRLRARMRAAPPMTCVHRVTSIRNANHITAEVISRDACDKQRPTDRRFLARLTSQVNERSVVSQVSQSGSAATEWSRAAHRTAPGKLPRPCRREAPTFVYNHRDRTSAGHVCSPVCKQTRRRLADRSQASSSARRSANWQTTLPSLPAAQASVRHRVRRGRLGLLRTRNASRRQLSLAETTTNWSTKRPPSPPPQHSLSPLLELPRAHNI